MIYRDAYEKLHVCCQSNVIACRKPMTHALKYGAEAFYPLAALEREKK